jgi:hypothetical protein
MKSEPGRERPAIGFAILCFAPNCIGWTCPHDDSLSGFSSIYEPPLKLRLLQILHRSMLNGQKLNV